ncbi:helix-turn-helix transcriptional regulator [bacterium]|nr:helix-turn-helix transcriptional regulator [bacterium]
MNLYSMSDRALLEEIGSRARRRRLDKNISQQGLADISGLNRSTVSALERGAPSSLLTLIQVLRALGALDELDLLLRDTGPSPLQLAALKGRQRRRASRRKAPKD